jgi:hypothetical protein
LDGLAARPIWQTEYLVLFGRVWPRRDLVWVGFGLWVLMVWRGLPGSWRQRSPGARRQVGRAYLPGFVLRMAFLVSLLMVPVFASMLLYPLALLTILGRGRSAFSGHVRCLLGASPVLAFTLFLASGQLAGWLVLEPAMAVPGMLVLLTLAAYCAWQRAGPAPGAVESSRIVRPPGRA